ncbi:3854_t:CDS:2 [Acaulospora colombiana]|uniref:3854_t:CDS:1 n=1 Tax=Acaulospora colombiana TaxID=27376 RepID=A0ACA9K1Y1_9GLOM|nr:3854_t:CDS:2 [Acaulospora colombiana]
MKLFARLLSHVNLQELPSILMVGAITYVVYFYYKYFTRKNPLPGPIPLPLFGNFFMFSGDNAIVIKNLQAKYGDIFEFYRGPNRVVCLLNEDLVKEMMKPTLNSNFFQLTSHPDELKELGLFKAGIIYNDYDGWVYNRRFFAKTIISPAFCKQAVVSVQAGFEEMNRYWDQLGEDFVLDLADWMKRYFMETIVITTTSKPANALVRYYEILTDKSNKKKANKGSDESGLFIDAVNSLFLIVGWYEVFPSYVRNFPGFNIYTAKLRKKFFWLRDNILKTIRAKRAEIDATPEGQPLVPDMLTMFLTINTPRDITERIADDLHTKSMSDEQIFVNYLEVMLGGIDTGSNTSCFVVHYLAHYPEVKKKLLKEFETVTGGNPDIKITVDLLNKLEYTEAVIKEVNRVFTVVPIGNRINRDPVTIGGITFPSGTSFTASRQALHMQKSLWSKPEEFNPDRFLKSNPENKNPFYMFGAGERKCPGRNLAMIEVKATLLMLYMKYDVELVDMNAPINYQFIGRGQKSAGM